MLLDSHTLIWFITNDPKLSVMSSRLIVDDDSIVLVSLASLWEISIKMSLGKLLAGRDFNDLFPRQLTANAMDLLPIQVAHIARVSSLPLHHRDPFDRLLVAQSLEENLPILSADPAFDAYGVQRIW